MKWILDLFRPPVFDDRDTTLRAQLLNILILGTFIAIPLLFVGNYLEARPIPFVWQAGSVALVLTVWVRHLMYRNKVYLASILWVILATAMISANAISLGTLRTSSTALFLVTIAVAGLLVNRNAMRLVTAYNAFFVFAFVLAVRAGWIHPIEDLTDLNISLGFNYLALFIGMALLIATSIQVLNHALLSSQKELEERRKTEQTLRQRDAIMQAATLAASRFLQATDWRAEIDQVLKMLGEVTHSSHVFLFENHMLDDGTEVTSQRYEWVAPGMKADLHNPLYQNMRIYTPEIREWYEAMRAGEAYYGIRDILSPKEIKVYTEEGLQSFINVPIFVGGKWWGLIGFDDYLTSREWTLVEVDAVKITASTLGSAIQQQIDMEALQRRDAILQAVNFAAQRFLQTKDWRQEIPAVLAYLGKAAQVSHVYIFEKHILEDGTPALSQRYEWVAEGVSPDIDEPDFQNVKILRPDADPWYEALARGEVHQGNLMNVPRVDQEHFRKHGFKTLIDAPIMVEGLWWGVIGFDDSIAMRTWSVAEIEAVKLAARTLAAAVQRQLNDEQMRQSELRHRVELEQRVQERTQQLAEALREIENVSYTASHDLRAPVRAINGYASILLKEYAETLNRDEQDYLQKIERESTRMGNLLDDLIRLIQLNRQPMRLIAISLSELAAKAADKLAKRFPAQSIALDIQPDLLAYGDEEMLQALVDELLDNAWKFTTNREPACITVGFRTMGKPAFYVQDNGIGFDMAYAHRLFRNFEQLHLPGTYAGTGMGLAIVQRIVQRHGGEVWAEGVPGGGATIYFTLPRGEGTRGNPKIPTSS